MQRKRLTATAAMAVLMLGAARPGMAADLDLVVTGLDLPVSMAFAPDGRLFVAEQHRGDIRIVKEGRLLPAPFAHLDVIDTYEQGLLGIALHPEFPREPWVYAYYSDPGSRINRLIRIRADGDRGGDREVLLDLLSTEAVFHNGGDLVFGRDGMLYVTVGDAHDEDRAQVVDDLGGKVIRIAPDGSVPADNPFGADSLAYSMGHRNSFGICSDAVTGDLWETENGPTSHDEVNRLEPGGNFGWPLQLGRGGQDRGFVDPVLDYLDEIVPTGCAVWEGDLYFGAFADGFVRRLRLPAADPARSEPVASIAAGITDLAVGPDGALYVAATDGIHRLSERDPAAIAGPNPGRDPSGALPWWAGAAAIVVLLAGLAGGRRLRERRS
jgi:quinoprotein glucose dehydrogenase